MEISWTALRRTRPQALAKLVRSLRAGEQAFQQSAQVKPSAANNDGKMPTLHNRRQSRACLAGVFPGTERVSGLGDVDQVMRNASAIFARRLRRTNLEIAIHSNRVATDNLAREFLGEMDGERRLARGRRSEDHD
jgi:hypothetical protein